MRIFKYLKKYSFFAIIAPIMMVGEVLMDLIQPKFMAIMINNGINYSFNGDEINGFFSFVSKYSELWFGTMDRGLGIILFSGICMILSVILGGTFGVLCGVFANIAAYKFSNDLRCAAFDKIMNLSYEQTDAFTTGSLVTRMTNDVTQVQNMVNQIIRGLIRSLMQFVLGTYFLLSIKLEFGFILLAILPIEIVLIIFFINKLSPYFYVVQEKVDNVNSVVQENVTGARVVKAYTKEEYEKGRFKDANQALYDINWKLFRFLSMLSPLILIFLSISMLSIYFIGGRQIYINAQSGVLAGLQTGDIISAVTYVTTVMMGFMMLSMMFQSLVRGRASIKRINEVLDSKPALESGSVKDTNSSFGTVEFRNVSFAYPNTSEAVLTNINLKIEKGERIGILGATGAGKTSLVNLIPRFYDATEGEIFVDETNVKDYDLKALRNKVRMALQKSELYSGTIKDNICFSNHDASMDDVIRASKIAQADSFITSFNDGYDTLVTEKGSSLSGGQKQRIAIARCILSHPEIMIFDDSTSALDLETEAKLYEALNKEMKDITIITIAQRVSSVRNADKIVIINDGRIVDVGSHEELLERCAIYIDIYNSQLKKDGDNDAK